MKPQNLAFLSTLISILGAEISENWGFRPSNLLGVHMNTSIGDKLFQEVPRRVAKFRENRPRDEKLFKIFKN